MAGCGLCCQRYHAGQGLCTTWRLLPGGVLHYTHQFQQRELFTHWQQREEGEINALAPPIPCVYSAWLTYHQHQKSAPIQDGEAPTPVPNLRDDPIFPHMYLYGSEVHFPETN